MEYYQFRIANCGLRNVCPVGHFYHSPPARFTFHALRFTIALSAICHLLPKRPCIRGLRYPVDMILELLSGGMSSQEILDDYDDLEPEDILVVLAFAARLAQIKRVQSVLL